MKTKGQVAQKFKQVQFRHVQKEMRRLLSRSAPNCKKNRSMELDFGPVGVCSLDCNVCDARFQDRAPECPDWEPRHSKEQIKESLKEFFKVRTVPEIAVRFPDAAALLWVLSDEGDPQEGPLPEMIPSKLFGVPVWVDSDTGHKLLAEAARTFLESAEVCNQLAADLDYEGASAQRVLEGVRSMRENLHNVIRTMETSLKTERAEREQEWIRKLEENAKLSGEVGVLQDRVEKLEQENRELLKSSPLTRKPWWRALWPF